MIKRIADNLISIEVKKITSDDHDILERQSIWVDLLVRIIPNYDDNTFNVKVSAHSESDVDYYSESKESDSQASINPPRIVSTVETISLKDFEFSEIDEILSRDLKAYRVDLDIDSRIAHLYLEEV